MTDLLLPLLDDSASCEEALAAMKAHGRSGVITHQHGRLRLYTAWSIVFALSENPTVTLAEIEPEKEMVEREYERANAYAVASAGGSGLPEDLEDLSVMPFSVEGDLLTALQASPKDCYCSADNKPVPGGRTGGNCPRGHTGTVRCV